MSGHAEVAKIWSGMVELSLAGQTFAGRSAMRDTSGGRCAWIPFWIAAIESTIMSPGVSPLIQAYWTV